MSPFTPRTTPKTDRQPSPVSRGADCGVFFGLLFTAMFLCYVYATTLPVLTFIFLALAVAIPFIIFRVLRSDFRTSGGTLSVTSMWIQGITMIAGGAILCSLVALAYFKWIEPDYIINQLHRIIELYQSTSDPSLEQFADLAQGLIDNQKVPRPSLWVTTICIFTVAAGSMLSGLMAVLVKASAATKSPPPPDDSRC